MRTLILVVSAYIAAQILADITSLKIIAIWGFSMDAGTLIYPLTFTLRDLAHKKIGANGTRTLIFAAAGINLFMAGLFWLVAVLPGDANVGAQSEFAKVLAPVWRIVLASIIAEVISELLDTEIYRLWVERITRKHQWARVLISNAVSVPVDSAFFCFIAFWGVFSPAVVLAIFWSNVIVKGVVTIFSIPGIYLVKEDNL